MPSPPRLGLQRGRGPTLNAAPSRFGLAAREADGDWLDAAGVVDGQSTPLRTSITVERPRTIITRNQSPDAPALLKAELAKRGYQSLPIALGTNTDPYQPIEHVWKITRHVLEVLHDYHHPVTVTTKSDRVCRDLDILAAMAARGLAAIRSLSAAGVPVFISLPARRPLPPAPPPFRCACRTKSHLCSAISWRSISPTALPV